MKKSELRQLIKEELKYVNEGNGTNTRKIKDMVYNIQDQIDQLVDLGEDYSIFQNAKGSHKALKQIQKLIQNVR